MHSPSNYLIRFSPKKRPNQCALYYFSRPGGLYVLTNDLSEFSVNRKRNKFHYTLKYGGNCLVLDLTV